MFQAVTSVESTSGSCGRSSGSHQSELTGRRIQSGQTRGRGMRLRWRRVEDILTTQGVTPLNQRQDRDMQAGLDEVAAAI
jgi:hypothetical protein